MNITIYNNLPSVKTQQLIEVVLIVCKKDKGRIPQGKFYIVHKWKKKEEIMFFEGWYYTTNSLIQKQ